MIIVSLIERKHFKSHNWMLMTDNYNTEFINSLELGPLLSSKVVECYSRHRLYTASIHIVAKHCLWQYTVNGMLQQLVNQFNLTNVLNSVEYKYPRYKMATCKCSNCILFTDLECWQIEMVNKLHASTRDEKLIFKHCFDFHQISFYKASTAWQQLTIGKLQTILSGLAFYLRYWQQSTGGKNCK